jgi:hypothetical protein
VSNMFEANRARFGESDHFFHVRVDYREILSKKETMKEFDYLKFVPSLQRSQSFRATKTNHSALGFLGGSVFQSG